MLARVGRWPGRARKQAWHSLLRLASRQGMVLTAIGGGMLGGVAGYFGGDWIADFSYED